MTTDTLHWPVLPALFLLGWALFTMVALTELAKLPVSAPTPVPSSAPPCDDAEPHRATWQD